MRGWAIAAIITAILAVLTIDAGLAMGAEGGVDDAHGTVTSDTTLTSDESPWQETRQSPSGDAYAVLDSEGMPAFTRSDDGSCDDYVMGNASIADVLGITRDGTVYRLSSHQIIATDWVPWETQRRCPYRADLQLDGFSPTESSWIRLTRPQESAWTASNS